MIWRRRIGKWRITFTIVRVADIVGVHSLLEDGNHILMWDFDDKTAEQVFGTLLAVQTIYDLPNIYLLNTGTPDHYIAYCFQRNSWQRCKEIIAFTPHVDPNFFKFGVYRDKFTLRVSPKYNRKPKLVHILKSPVREDCSVDELKRWVQYETMKKAA